MASGPLVGGSGDGSREKHRWAESKVYTRKLHNKGSTNKTVPPPSSQTLATEDGNSSQQQQQQQQQQQLSTTRSDAVSDDSSSLPQTQAAVPIILDNETMDTTTTTTTTSNINNTTTNINNTNTREPASGNGLVPPPPRLEDRVTINLTTRSKQEMRELRRKLTNELDQVRNLVKKLEAKGIQFTGYSEAGGGGGGGGYSQSQVSASDAIANGGGVKRVNPEVASIGHHVSRPLNQLSVSVFENSHGGVGDVVEKEKRTPKANQYYRNSEFLLGKDKFPPSESYKKSKSHSGKKHGGGEGGYGFGVDKYTSQIFKSCSALLGKLMKHKHAWVFNIPVDVQGLGLHDYYTIIKKPMDLGTVKSRLSKNFYKSPREFADDVRLTFNNAMTYNPKGQDVHIMADQLSQIFEEKWSAVEREYNINRFDMDYSMALHTPMSRKAAPPPPLPPFEMRRTLDRSESMTIPTMDSNLRPSNSAPTGRVPAPKKPKAKDLNKRDMTYDEKQKLSTNLQSLPPEKLENIVQIIKKRDADVSQHDDEIEVDIDSVDTETLWELDRFVTNYKKSLSKNKRKAELAQAREAQRSAQKMYSVPAPPQAPVLVEVPKETITDGNNRALPSSSPVRGEKQGDNASRSSSSSSSSSDSGSSSSDSDSDSSSASDAGHSPRT